MIVLSQPILPSRFDPKIDKEKASKTRSEQGFLSSVIRTGLEEDRSDVDFSIVWWI